MADRYLESMTPRRLLALWRERWGKQSEAEETPYFPGAFAAWGRKLAHSKFWGWPGVAAGCAVLCVLFFALLVSIRFSLNEQVLFSVPLLVAALLATRYGGAVVTLMMAGLAAIASTRYLCWRLFETLDPALNMDFAVGFALWGAELVWFAAMLVGKARALWPLRREHVPLPAGSHEWPTVDLFLICAGHSSEAIRAAASERAAPDWPKKKLKLYLLDGDARENVRALAESIGAAYLVQPGKTEAINAALAQSKGELIAVLECDKLPDRSFLAACAGWFVHERRFAMLQTHDHFLAPPASARIRRTVEAPHAFQSFALMRRDMLQEIGGVETTPATSAVHTALKLQACGYGVAYAGVAADAADSSALNIEPQPNVEAEVFRIDFPFGQTVLWKQRIASLHRALRFYEPVPQMIFLLAPALGLLGGAALIQTSFTLFFAYAIPHLLQLHISQARMGGHGRLALWTEIRETALSWYMLALTAVNLVPVLIGRVIHSSGARDAVPHERFHWFAASPYLIAFALNLAGLGFGLARLLEQGFSRPEFAVLYLLWSLYNLLLLAAMLAVAEEARHVRWQMRLKRRMPAMVKLPSRRTVSCVTRNFPEAVLVLELKSPFNAGGEDAVHLSIFSGYREFDFPAQIILRQDGRLTLRIERSALPNYRALAAAIFARGADWPEWLPHRGADHPIPPWISKPALAAFVYILDWSANAARLLHFSRMVGWIQKWKKT